MKKFLLSSLVLALLLFSISAHAATTAMLFSVEIKSDPPATAIPQGEFNMTAQVGDTITFTRYITQSGVINNAWNWNHDSSKLDCGAFPDFDSPDFVCKVISPGTSYVSITMYPVMSDGSRRVITSNLIYVIVDGEIENDYPGIEIKDVNFYQKYKGEDNVIVFDICNSGTRTYEETEYGSLTFDVTIGDKNDGLAFSGNIDPGKCSSFYRAGLLDNFYGFADLKTGYYNMVVSLDNEIKNADKTEDFSKKVYILDSTQEATLKLKEDSSATSPPAAGYEDEVVVNAAAYNNPFPDTNLETLEGIAASELYRRAVLGGYPDGEFKGSREVNRAEAAKFLLLARFGLVDEIGNNGTFADVKTGEWYVKFVVTAANKGIINGHPDGSFRPQDSVNGAEFLKMLTLTFDLEENLEYSYNDVDSEDWFSKYAGIAEKYNLFPDRSSTLNPGENLTRKEVAIAIYQYLSNR